MGSLMKKDNFIRNAGIMFVATTVGSVCNLLYQLFMVRNLSPVDFGILNALLSLTIIVAMPAGPLQTVVTKCVATYKAHDHWGKIHTFLVLFLKKVFFLGMLIFFVLFIFRAKIAGFLKIENTSLVTMMGIMMALSVLQPFNLGALQGVQKFNSLGLISIFNAVLKLLFGILLVKAGFRVFGALGSIFLSGVIVLLFSFFSLRKYFFARYAKKFDFKDKELNWGDIYNNLLPAFIALPSFALLTNMDVVFVKHYFSPEKAGFYSIAQMIGKIILFLPGAVTIVMFPKVAENHTRNEQTVHILNKCLILVGILCSLAGLFCILFPAFVIKLFSGAVHSESIPLVMPFVVSMTFFALNSVFLYYYLSVHKLKPILMFMFTMLIQGVLINVFHKSLLQVLDILCSCAIVLFFVNVFELKSKRI